KILLFPFCYYISYLSRFRNCCNEHTVSYCITGRENVSQKYVLFSQGKSWSNAQTFCRQTHTDLVSVRNLDEDQQLQNLVLQNLGQNSGQRILVFIGLFKDDFRWTDNSSSMTRHWSIGEPDGSGACVVHSLSGSNKWADENCDQTRPFICQDESKQLIKTSQ
uniref:C-type lectin domain-containing protein n=1 Tax=Cyprinus carpio TaxID=7962 RepID=A0A8C2JY92_CYPCA